jgi:serine protease AprX
MDLHNNVWHDTGAGYHYGWDFYDNDGDPMDDYGHGTHCSGTVLGDGSEGTQTAVAPGATCMALRINYYSGGEYTWIQAMEFGTTYGAAVLTMSLGSGQGNTTLRTAEENLLTAGVYHSVAAGNDGSGASTILSSGDSPPPWFHPDQSYHGGNSAVVTVGATNSSDAIANFSSRGPVVCWSDYTDTSPLLDPDIVGPGVSVLSTQWGGGYTTMDGTSMATPHLAGVAALIIQANPSLSVAKIDSIIEVTALDLGATGKDNTYGAGRVDALAAVQAALQVGIGSGPQGYRPCWAADQFHKSEPGA